MVVGLPPGTEFVNASWKDNNLWYSYRPRPVGQQPTLVTYKEQSNYGIAEGTIRFQEK